MPKCLSFWFTCLLLVYGQYALGQDPSTLAEKQLETPVFLEPGSQTIGKILDSLSQEYRINFSYVNSQIPLDQSVLIPKKGYRLDDLLSFIFDKTSVKFFPVYDQIVLVKEKDLDFIVDTQVDSLGQLSKAIEIYPLFETTGGSIQIKTSELLAELAKIFLREDPLIDQLLAQSPDSSGQSNPQDDPILKKRVKGKEIFTNYKKVRKPPLKSFAWGIRFRPAAQLWKGKIAATPDTAIRVRNQYGAPDWTWSLGLWAQTARNAWNLSLGVEYQFQQKKGTHQEYFINTVYVKQLQENASSYSESYQSIRIPLHVGWADPQFQFKWYFMLGVFVEYRFQRSEAKNFFIYRDQYFSNLSVNSTGNVNQSPFFDANLEEIHLLPKQARPWSGGISLSMGRHFAWGEKHLVQLGPEFSMHLWSLYKAGSPIREYPISLGLHLLLLKR